MMFPLWTIVTERRFLSSAYWIAAVTRRFVFRSLIGLIPMPESSGIRVPISPFRNARTFACSSVPAFHSMPAYTSSVFSRNTTMSSFSGWRTGEGVPSYQRQGRMQQ